MSYKSNIVSILSNNRSRIEDAICLSYFLVTLKLLGIYQDQLLLHELGTIWGFSCNYLMHRTYMTKTDSIN